MFGFSELGNSVLLTAGLSSQAHHKSNVGSNQFIFLDKPVENPTIRPLKVQILFILQLGLVLINLLEMKQKQTNKQNNNRTTQAKPLCMQSESCPKMKPGRKGALSICMEVQLSHYRSTNHMHLT